MYEDKGLRYTNVSLSDRGKYITTFFVEGLRITMRCGYNTRNKLRWIILLDDDGNTLLPQTFVKYGKRCELGFLANQHGLHYYVTLKPRDPYKKYPEGLDYLFWESRFLLCFVGYSQELEEESQVLIRKHLVGN